MAGFVLALQLRIGRGCLSVFHLGFVDDSLEICGTLLGWQQCWQQRRGCCNGYYQLETLIMIFDVDMGAWEKQYWLVGQVHLEQARQWSIMKGDCCCGCNKGSAG